MKKILVPTHFSSCADNAANIAMNLAHALKAEVTFLHLMHVSFDWVHVDSNKDKFYKDVTHKVNDAHHKLDDWVKKAEKKGLIGHKHIQLDYNVSRLVKYAEETNVDLIVAGTHGASGPRELLMGSFAQRIVRLSAIPILVIKESTTVLEIKNLAFCSDFSTDSLPVYMNFIELAKDLGAAVHLLYVNTPHNFFDTPTMMNRISNFKDQSDNYGEISAIYNFETFEDGLERYSQENAIDVATLVTHGNRSLSRIFSGSFTESVVNHSKIPILSYGIGH